MSRQSSTLQLDLTLPLDKFPLQVSCDFSSNVIGVFGPSGSGKTSLLESIVGLRRHARGTIRCNNTQWLDSNAGIFIHTEDRNIGYVPQDHLLFPNLDVRKNLLFGAKSNNRANNSIDFDEVVNTLELTPLLDRAINELSGGEKQRVALGRALCSTPKLLVLDEPMASLDIELRNRILPYLIQIRNTFDIPILIVSHNPVEIQALCEEVIALREGKIIAQGNPTHVFTRPEFYPSEPDQGFQNLIPAKIVSHNTHTSQSGIGPEAEGQAIATLKCESPVFSQVMLGFPANDILIATRYVEKISARNQLAAIVDVIQTIGHKQIITTTLDDPSQLKIVVELTLASVEELDLKPGAAIKLIIKSSSVVVFE